MTERTEHPAERTQTGSWPPELAPPDYCDPVVEAFKKDVDRTLLRENLKLSVEKRLMQAERMHASLAGWREAGKQLAGIGRKDHS